MNHTKMVTIEPEFKNELKEILGFAIDNDTVAGLATSITALVSGYDPAVYSIYLTRTGLPNAISFMVQRIATGTQFKTGTVVYNRSERCWSVVYDY